MIVSLTLIPNPANVDADLFDLLTTVDELFKVWLIIVISPSSFVIVFGSNNPPKEKRENRGFGINDILELLRSSSLIDGAGVFFILP